MEQIGRFSLGNKVMVSDPCYGTDTWCQGVLENVREGFWDAYIKMSDEGLWGKRVAELVAINLDYNDEYAGLTSEDINEPQKFEVGVDSGTAGIFDYDYYCKYHTEKTVDDEWYDNQIIHQFFPTHNESESGLYSVWVPGFNSPHIWKDNSLDAVFEMVVWLKENNTMKI
jgi:hypothetical protein